MNRLENKIQTSAQRSNRARTQIKKNSDRPRLSVFVSNLHVSAQIIDDKAGKTLAGFTTVGKKKKGTKTELAEYVGTEIAKLAKAKKVKQVVFDRGSKKFHGRIKALADAARKEGLEF